MNTKPHKSDESPKKKLLPSDFMRQLRPEYFSDTDDKVAYRLEQATLDHHLETISARNEQHDFEIFARKLCERAICPNLRPQAGPEGGGDSKADAETYPVAEEVSKFYVGEVNSGKERWAFAFSAKKTWADKARRDVKGLIETGRRYDRIIVVTARYARAKARAKTEDDLSKKYGIPVTIHDRAWILSEVIEKDRKDIAFNYLRVGEVNKDPLRLGPSDYSRSQQLEAIEKELGDPTAFEGMENQRVTDALLAAKLSRNLERPRTETDGRFIRAIRLAEKDGSHRQKLEANYEALWTAYWWFDDIEILKRSYESFERMVLPTDHATYIELLCNLFQLLVNSVTHDLLAKEEAQLEERAKTINSALEAIAANRERPNNSLEAETSLIILRLNMAMNREDHEQLPGIWQGFGSIMDRAAGLGEFNADRLVKMIEAVGVAAGDDASYNELIEKLAVFVSIRTSEAQGALILLRRASSMSFSNRIDMIRLLGKATAALSKKEHQDSFIEATYALSVAYRSAGLLWAARASIIMAAASVVIQGEEDSMIPPSFIPALKTWAWISIQLRHIPDFLFAIQLLNGALATLPLTDESKDLVRSDIRELDAAMGCVLLNLAPGEEEWLAVLPDVMDAFGLFLGRSALLYSFGYLDVIRKDGSVPAVETDEAVHEFYSLFASQPVNQQSSGPLIVHGNRPERLQATILGMEIEVEFDASNDNMVVVAEIVLAALEAFLATTIDQDVIPHTERFSISLVEREGLSAPEVQSSATDFTATISWPNNLSFSEFTRRSETFNLLLTIVGHVMGIAFMVRKPKELLDRLHNDEAVHQRLSMVGAVSNSYHRIASRSLSRLSDWKDQVKQEFPLKAARPVLDRVVIKAPQDDEEETKTFNLSSHRGMEVRSVIDVHTWDDAGWHGSLYFMAGPNGPPGLAFVFKDEASARKIFERWRARFGQRDVSDEIKISFIRKLPRSEPFHYIVVVTSKRPESDQAENKAWVMPIRSLTMTPQTPENLENFLERYSEWGWYLLTPAVMKDGQPDLIMALSVAKRGLSVMNADDVKDEDAEAATLRQRGLRGPSERIEDVS